MCCVGLSTLLSVFGTQQKGAHGITWKYLEQTSGIQIVTVFSKLMTFQNNLLLGIRLLNGSRCDRSTNI